MNRSETRPNVILFQSDQRRADTPAAYAPYRKLTKRLKPWHPNLLKILEDSG